MTRLFTPMQTALDLAREAAAAGEVPVGAVITDPETQEIVSVGANQPITFNDPTQHAEIVAIRAAAAKLGNYRMPGLHLYVTLEPCAMCAGAISLARLGKVIFAASDPKGGVILHGPKLFSQPTLHWRPEVGQDTDAAPVASKLLKDFFRARR